MRDSYCCYIDDHGAPCSQKARWRVAVGPALFDYTESCPSHVGFLIPNRDGKGNEITWPALVRLECPETDS